MTERIAMLVTATTADELVCALRSINGPVSIDERVENDELIRIVVAGETVFTLVPFRAPERAAGDAAVADLATLQAEWRELVRAIVACLERIGQVHEIEGFMVEPLNLLADLLATLQAERRERGRPDFVVDEGTVRSLERELERRAARIAALETVLREDAAGESVDALLLTAARHLYQQGGGPLVTRLRMLADAITALLAVPPELPEPHGQVRR